MLNPFNKSQKRQKKGQIIKNNFYINKYLSQYNNKNKLLLAIILKKRFGKKNIKINSQKNKGLLRYIWVKNKNKKNAIKSFKPNFKIKNKNKKMLLKY